MRMFSHRLALLTLGLSALTGIGCNGQDEQSGSPLERGKVTVTAGKPQVNALPSSVASTAPAECVNPPVVKFAWSFYTSWSLLAAANDFGDFNENEGGQLGRFEKEFCVDVVMLRQEYLPSMTSFQTGAVDGVLVTNTDALAVAYGRLKQVKDATVAVFPTSWSNGADKILTDNSIKTWADLTGVPVRGAEFSVSHYLFYRGCQIAKCDWSKLKFENLEPDKGAPRFANKEKDFKAFAGWSPETFVILDTRASDVTELFDSSKLDKFEITDLLLVGQSVLDRAGGRDAVKVLASSMREMMGRIVTQNGSEIVDKALLAISARFNNLPPASIERALSLTPILSPDSDLFTTPEFQANMAHVEEFSTALNLTEGTKVVYGFGDKVANPTATLRFDGSSLK